MKNMNFASLGLDTKLLAALDKAGYTTPTEVQEKVIPLALDGNDILASSQTGTGKTAAFSLPLLQRLKANEVKDATGSNKRKLRALIMAPTRELAVQIEESLRTYGENLNFKVQSFVGGIPIRRQQQSLKNGVDIVVATPGRLLDLINRRALNLRQVEYFVLDEADRMLDMGFIHDIQDIARMLPKKRQTLLFSATISERVKQLASVLLFKPQLIAASPADTVAKNIKELVYLVDRKNKRALLSHLLQEQEVERALVFAATKSEANTVAILLNREGITSEAIHADKSQKDRQRALNSFDKGEVKVLVATDVVARGIDVEGITHVINYEFPGDADSYVHRIGRTARAGASGMALSFCEYEELSKLRSVENMLGEPIEIASDQPYHSPFVETMKNQKNTGFAKRRPRASSSRSRF